MVYKRYHLMDNYCRSRIKSTKKSSGEFKLEDLFGTVSFGKDSKNSKYPNTVPFAKGAMKNGDAVTDIFDNSNSKPSHSSANIAPRRKNQQVFVSNGR